MKIPAETIMFHINSGAPRSVAASATTSSADGKAEFSVVIAAFAEILGIVAPSTEKAQDIAMSPAPIRLIILLYIYFFLSLIIVFAQ